jgi:cell shape-determining protein MreD
MTWAHTFLVLGAAFVAVFGASAVTVFRSLLGAQFDLLPALVVYVGLTGGLATVALLAIAGGLWLDSLSANPLGISVLPLFLVGWFINATRDLVLRDQTFARWFLGLGASACVPVLTLLLLLTTGHKPLLGWGTLWQIVVSSAVGGCAAPVVFWVFERLQMALVHGKTAESSFRPDREIRRGR